jgi:hypothetical protein
LGYGELERGTGKFLGQLLSIEKVDSDDQAVENGHERGQLELAALGVEYASSTHRHCDGL